MAVILESETEGKEAQLAIIRSRMRQIEKVIAGLKGITTKVEYVLSDNETIKSIYHLAGKKYENLTTDEEAILSDVEGAFNKKRSTVIGDLESKYRALQQEASLLL
ncbi:hypothetical protein [Streptococcus cristatus]|uniref:hypothetical protein n=1 Tax=Streptococcus cristatus TaxID=45634 RepID=UPI0005EF5CEC|nr:hypothetical protein [Streptococcus cristatus]KJQ57731.1 hypothetical protein TW70_01469 [Streptococcus cristatus]QIP48568.1 ATP-binding protein [Streptococcus cristatus ATCC 51100]